ncbi:SET and MYND domain-containing protein 4 [Trichonephila inaurata madagascariensis]|uniref:Protein-lysine N-methyltransferase SMYD4 n=1 Tax=Trichonephila inaurata madagascariensis TaxID=2747483 RepID=A0A8X6WSR5_9ARAC|nr:SET and MYND domain-containing protein 4 [Trichonephila inaurata madagascariensis]
MAAYTCWQDVLDDITNRVKKTKTLTRFSKLKNNEDRIEYCLRDDFIRSKVQQWLNIMCSSRHKKYWEKASELRAEGNLCFQEKKYSRAVEFYTQSILAAPFPKSEDAGSHVEELSLGFGNRSAALFHLLKNEECLKDIDKAIEYDYPRDLRFKLLQRKGQCLMKLNQPALALEAFQESLKLLEEARLDSRRIARQQKEVEALIKTTEEMEKPNEDETDQQSHILALSYGPHPSIDSASSSIDIKYDKSKGRYIIANRTITAGDTLFVEEPYASVLLPVHYPTHCHHCYTKALAVVPCHQCSQVRYCSQKCVDESWEKYHKWECGNLDSLHSVGIAHLSFRVILVTALSFIQEHREELVKTSNSVYPFDFPDGKYRTNYFSVFHLVAHEDMPAEDTFQYALTALLLLMLLDRLNYFATLESQTLRERLISCNLNTRVGSAPSTPTHKSRSPVHSRLSINSVEENDLPTGPASLEIFVGGLLLRHILQLICNANAITELQAAPQANTSSVLNQRQVKVASGIFPSASLMNHSCNPTVISSFCKNVLIVRAICDVEPGQEIFNCYGPHYRRMPREDRQRSLLEQYFFICECDACVNEDEREQRFQALKCSYCSGPLRAPDNTNRTSCLDCDKSQDCASQLQKVFTAHDMFVQGLQLAAKGNFKDALERLKKCHKIREKVMYKYNRHLSEVQDQLACCYASLDKMMLAVEYLRPTLIITEHIYGKNSIEYGNELQKFSDLLINALAQATQENASCDQEFRNLVEETRSVLEKSYDIFSIHYGPYHESLKEIKEKQKQLDAFLER